ncbi:MAG: hypothetical protein IPM84_20305 [Anaerolineae bacterium]|nr:hypothetical protein [Anaerolineae bacterium]
MQLDDRQHLSQVEAQHCRGRPDARLLAHVRRRDGACVKPVSLDPGPIRAAHKHDRQEVSVGTLILFHRPAAISQRDVAVY